MKYFLKQHSKFIREIQSQSLNNSVIKLIVNYMIKNSSIVLLLISFQFSVFTFNSNAQISTGGIPLSFSKKYLLNEIPFVLMPSLDIRKLIQEDSIEGINKTIPWRFAKDIDVNFTMSNSGQWQTLAGGDKIWHLAIKSAGAFNISLIFSKFYLPEGSKLFIYNSYKDILGAYTYLNNRDDSLFSTTILKGDMIFIEYYQPKIIDKQAVVNISKVVHSYKSLESKLKDYGNSGKCNVNINCPEGDSWYNEKRAVTLILTGNNTRICSGALVNNAREDGTPYLLTAHHCIVGENISTWIFMFNYESPACANQDGPTNQTLFGSELKATDTPSDFALIKLLTVPPATYNVFYAGWSAVETPFDSCVAIHHPLGDIKKITFDYDTIVSSNWDTGVNDSHWTIKSWNKGTTEKGSSGCPLFNKFHKIIGQLHGGNAACYNSSDDNFGQFAYSWNNGSSISTRLKDWLDPDNTGTKELIGKDFNHSSFQLDAGISKINSPDIGYTCDSSFIPIITVKNYGSDDINSLTINYSIDNLATKSFQWTGKIRYMNSINIKLDTINFTLGNHIFKAKISSVNLKTDMNNTNDSTSVSFNIIKGNNISLTLYTDRFSDETSWEIKDSTKNILFKSVTGLKSNTKYNDIYCLADGCYDFTIFDSYGDGMNSKVYPTDTGYVLIYYNGKKIGGIRGDEFKVSATIHFCLNYPDNVNSSFLNNSDLDIFPNPSNNYFYINNLNFHDFSKLYIYNSKAQLVLNKTLTSNNKIDIKNLENGIYFIKIVNDKTVVNRKFIKLQ